MKKRLIATLLIGLLSSATLVACGKSGDDDSSSRSHSSKDDDEEDEDEDEEDEDEEDDEEAGEAAAEETAEDPEITKGGYWLDDNRVIVDNTADLVDSIRSDVTIYVKPGVYNISDYLTKVAGDYSWINEHDPELSVSAVMDGYSLNIGWVDNLTIRGLSPYPIDVQIVTDPRNSTLFSFAGCNNIVLDGLMMGHTDGADCSADVLDFYECGDVSIYHCNIFGCGYNGIYACSGTGYMSVYDTMIHDCEAAPVYAWDAGKQMRFVKCDFLGSGSFDFSDPNGGWLDFQTCFFGDNETAHFRAEQYNVCFSDCEWTRIAGGPGTYGVPDYFSDRLVNASVDEESIAGSEWKALFPVDVDAGEAISMMPIVRFDEGGTGRIIFSGSSDEFTWEYDKDNLVTILLDNGVDSDEALFYTDPEDGTLFMRITYTVGGDSYYYTLYQTAAGG